MQFEHLSCRRSLVHHQQHPPVADVQRERLTLVDHDRVLTKELSHLVRNESHQRRTFLASVSLVTRFGEHP